MNHDRYDDSYIRGILNTVKNVAVVGASPGENRPSMFVVKYLAERGYRVFPINPGRGGQEIGGEKAYAKLADVPEKIDMIDVFRNSESVPPVLDEVLALPRRPDVFWMQQGVRNDAVAARAEAGHEGGDGSLSQDRIRPPLRRDQLGRRQYADALVEAAAALARRCAAAQARRRGQGGRLTSAPADK